MVTGGSGFLGGHVAETLLRAGHEVLVFDVQQPLWPYPTNGHCSYFHGDLLDPASLRAAINEIQAVCHLGGVGDVYLAAKEPVRAAQANVVGTANVMEAALTEGVRKVVYASTWEVYGEPQYQPVDESHPCKPEHPYNITKYGGELLGLSYDHLQGVPFLPLRIGTAFGPRMRANSVFSLFTDRARRGEPIVIQGSGAQTRQFTHARDIARAFLSAIDSPLRGRPVNIVSDELTSIRRLAELINDRLPTRVEHGPARSGDIQPSRISSAAATELLGWRAQISFQEGLNEIIEAAESVNV